MKRAQILIFTALLVFISFSAVRSAQTSLDKRTSAFQLGETAVKVNVYEKAGSPITFTAPHYNEQIAIRLAKEAVAKNGGRLIEIESVDEKGNPSRRVNFRLNGKSYSVDPNRIFTENGRACGRIPVELEAALKNFADNLLKIVFAPEGNRLREGERFIVAVHNNGDVDDKSLEQRAGDLTAVAFVNASKTQTASRNIFQAQAAGVYLSNLETDEDNFVFLSSPALISFFAEKGFNVVVQKSAKQLQSQKCEIDDGSLSVYLGQQNISYICLEADAQSGATRQRQMFEAVYELLPGNRKADATGDEVAVK